MNSVVAKGKTVPAFFFTFKVEGPGCPIIETKTTKKSGGVTGSPRKVNRGSVSENTINSPGKSAKKGGGAAKDPITVSIKERKDGGSILTQIAAKGMNEVEAFKLELVGKGPKIVPKDATPNRRKRM